MSALSHNILSDKSAKQLDVKSIDSELSMIIRNTFSLGTSDIDRVETHPTASHFCQTGYCGTMLTLMHTRHAHKMGRYEFHGTTGQNLMIIEA